MPIRLQYRRDPAWRPPPKAIYVARPSIWGNPFAIGTKIFVSNEGDTFQWALDVDRGLAIALFKAHVQAARLEERIRTELAGHDLLCWCKPSDDCHADYLLAIANSLPEGQQTLEIE